MLGLCCYGRAIVVSLRLQIAVASALSAFALLASPAAAIVNGTTAGGSSWPWAVQVLLVGPSGIDGICGGTLVQPQRVVTSGDCTTSGADLYVIANSKKLADESVPIIQVTDFERAPNWSSFSANDVAILELAAAPDPAVPIAVLGADESADFPSPVSALIAGWGATDASSGDPSETLRQGQVSLEAGCGEAGLLCSDTSTEPCFGDLGGPAIVQLGADTVSKDPNPENGTWRLVALPLGGTEDCTQIFYADLTQPAIRAFIEDPDGEQPGTGGGNPTPLPSQPLPSPATPPQTKLKKTQIDAGKGKASFRFKGSGDLTGFQCALASGKRTKPKFRPCRSPKTYKKLAPGTYVFKVRAVGPGGPDATPAKKQFTILSA
jgi:hypothetical protein